MLLATSSIAFQMKHEAELRRIALEREVKRAREVAIATRDELPRGIEDLTPGRDTNVRSLPRWRAVIVRRIPGLSGT